MHNQVEISATELEQIAIETYSFMQEGDDEKVVKLLDRVNLLFQKGTTVTQNLVANSFILPLTNLLEMNYSWGMRYLKILPHYLKKEHHNQVYATSL